MGVSPPRPQNYLFGCELKSNKDDHLKVDNDKNEQQLFYQCKFPQKKAKFAANEDDEDDEDNDDDDEDDDVDFEDEEAEEKAPGKESLRDTPGKNAQKSNQNGRDSRPSTPRSKGQEYFKKQEKIPKTPKGPSSIEVIKAKIQASIEEGGSLPKVEAKFINYVKNCFRMTDPEVIQRFGHWRKCLIENSLNSLLKFFILFYFCHS
ncbi:nucleophosmin-like [Molossus molossus]|uniref:Nucleophosmin n=1 Tax=Molossus molossus TaxID=27622 RepID=A0A7J8GL57_MOLMO|nr:nucleophosmin-like [Molossus molossus]KAF6460521.1 hypothetical protein HJG59_011436 [Molossus molossus]